MKLLVRLLVCVAVLGCHNLGVASDHADPMSLNTLLPQDAPLANITDLHAFVVDKDGKPVLTPDRIPSGERLIISLCVRRRLLFGQINDPKLEEGLPALSFRVHLDFNPDVTHHNPEKLPDGRKYVEVLAEFDKQIAAATAERKNRKQAADAAHGAAQAADSSTDQELKNAQTALDALLGRRNDLIARYNLAARMEALYGASFNDPSMIAEEATLDFRLKLMRSGDTLAVELNDLLIAGIKGNPNFIPGQRIDAKTAALPASGPEKSVLKPGAINVQAGFFDDPFIFPRFFRGNVIGIVTSIPLESLRLPDGTRASQGTILLWATTHDEHGQQSDHVGRSLRTQLPRFGYLNTLPPSAHVKRILQRHGEPTLLENSLVTFIAPLEAHRFYDAVPDVMVYDLSRPAKFPNGRWLEDDVSQLLADAGETLLYELSLSESRQFPRATTNDKPFRMEFPYLADPWSEQETKDHALAGTSLGSDFKVPDAPDAGATALPDFVPEVWRSIWLGLVLGIIVTGGLAALALQSVPARVSVLLAAIVCIGLLTPIMAKALTSEKPGFMQQPYEKLKRVIFGSGVVTLLGLTAVYAAGVRHGRVRPARPAYAPLLAEEGATEADQQYTGSTYQEVRDAVFNTPYSSPVPWGTPGTSLPVYHIPFWTLAKGVWLRSLPSPFRDAASRTISSHADLRWGKNRRGVLRLLHPHGVCLAGRWRITQKTAYTGYFASDKECLIIARYSSANRLRSEPRTLSLVGKLFPTLSPGEKTPTASFITQSALGGLQTESIFDASLSNAPDIFPLASADGTARLLLSLLAFRGVDTHPSERQLYEIAEAGEDTTKAGWKTVCPRFMRLSLKSDPVVNDNLTEDFRDDVLSQLYQRGDSGRKYPPLVFKIEVSNAGEVKGFVNKTLVGTTWDEIGEIEFTEAVASHNGDFVIHFHHPKWRDEPGASQT